MARLSYCDYRKLEYSDHLFITKETSKTTTDKIGRSGYFDK